MSFDNLKNTKIKRPNLALFTLLTILSIAFAIFLPLFGIAGVIFMPVPATVLVLSGRIRDGIICAVISSLVLIFYQDYLLVAVIALLIIGLSFVYRNSAVKGKNKLFTVSCIFSVFAGALLIYTIAGSIVSRSNYISEFIVYYNSGIERVMSTNYIAEYAELMNIDLSQVEVAAEQAKGILEFVLYIIPGLLVSLLAFISLMNYLVTNEVLKRYKAGMKEFPSLMYWDTPWYLCWGMILGLVLIATPTGSQSFDRIMDIAGANLVAVFGLLYLILGIAVIWGLMERFKLSRMARTFIFILLGLFFNFALLFIIFIGLIDVWVNFRKLKRGKLA